MIKVRDDLVSVILSLENRTHEEEREIGKNSYFQMSVFGSFGHSGLLVVWRDKGKNIGRRITIQQTCLSICTFYSLQGLYT